jgi:magnesium-transporting ATPase (P-type)
MPSSETNRELEMYCCGCDSRTASLNANIFLLVIGCLYAAVGTYGLNDTNPQTAATDEERVLVKAVVTLMAIQIIVTSTAIWGLCTYRGWPVMLSLGWLSTGMALGLVRGYVAVFAAGNVVALFSVVVALFFQANFFWMPMYSYINEHTKLKELKFSSEVTESGGAFSDKRENQSLEMV